MIGKEEVEEVESGFERDSYWEDGNLRRRERSRGPVGERGERGENEQESVHRTSCLQTLLLERNRETNHARWNQSCLWGQATGMRCVALKPLSL